MSPMSVQLSFDNHMDGWAVEDFTESAGLDFKEEDDPWGDPPSYDGPIPVPENSSHISEDAPAVRTRSEQSEPTSLDIDDVSVPEMDDWSNDESDDFDLSDRESYAELAILLEWDDGRPNDISSALIDTLDDFEGVVAYQVEPEPIAEYDSELGQPLYGLDDDITDLSRKIKISEWVASIGHTTATLFQEIVRLLEGFSIAHLRSWLPWLRKQDWTGQSLLLFLKFHLYWEANPHWWEASFWDRRLGCYRPTWSRYSLSRDDQFDLVKRRLDYSPAEVIDKAWFEDWEHLALWEYGYPSFADFALFRSILKNGEDWRSFIDWYATSASVRDIRVLGDSPSEKGDPSHLSHQHGLPQYGLPLWLAEQDWYDPSEWHDNLGW